MFNKFLNRNKSSRRTNAASRRLQAVTADVGQLTVRKHRPDYVLMVVSIALLVVGLIVVYSISPGLAASGGKSQGYYVGKQIISIILGLATFALMSSISLEALKRSKRLLIWITAVMVIAVQILGEQVNGAYRWIQIGGFSFQVAELIKFTLIVWLASFLVMRMARDELDSFDKMFKPLLISLFLIGVVVAYMQSDLGSAGVMVAILAVMAYVAGLPLKRLAMIGGVILIGTILAISTSDYRRERLETFINPTSDCQSAGYQSCQALIAVGSGGIFGLGLGNSVQAYGYLPEAANDSIFAIIAEKFGFIGSSLVIGLYALLFARMRRVIQCTQDLYSRLFVIGVLVWLSVQAIINMGAMIGLLPLKGITLPLISYGGSSIILVLAALGVVFRISRYTTYAPVRSVRINEGEGEANEGSARGRRQRRPYYATASSR